MAIQLVGYASSTLTGVTTATQTVSLTGLTGGISSTAAAGDLVLVVSGWAGTADGNPGVTTVGYTEITDIYSNDTRDTNMSVAYKKLSSAETSVIVSASGITGSGSCAIACVYRGVSSTNPIDVTSTTATGLDTSAPNPPAITPVTANTLIVATGLGSWIGGGGVSGVATPPTGYSNHYKTEVGGSSNGSHAMVASKTWSGSGAEDPGAWTGITGASFDSWAAVTIALREQVSIPNTGNMLMMFM